MDRVAGSIVVEQLAACKAGEDPASYRGEGQTLAEGWDHREGEGRRTREGQQGQHSLLPVILLLSTHTTESGLRVDCQPTCQV